MPWVGKREISEAVPNDIMAVLKKRNNLAGFYYMLSMSHHSFFKVLLFPFALLYDLVTRIRNYLYDSGKWHSARFDVPVISVGNLNTGGSGKTPHTEYLIALLKDHYKVATLSRGYGRKSKGFLIATAQSDVYSIGDEPYQMYKKFPEITVSVGGSRLLAIPMMLRQLPGTQVIILDDAYQHRSVVPGLNILLTDYRVPFYKDHVLPAGRLREARKGYRRADIIVVTKCPADLSTTDQDTIKERIKPFPHQTVYFSNIVYGPLRHGFYDQEYRADKEMQHLVVTGIAQPQRLYEHLADEGIPFKKLAFPDHHYYTEKDILTIIRKAQSVNPVSPVVITTEKDAVRMDRYRPLLEKEGVRLLMLPIRVCIMNNGSGFDKRIFQFVKKII